MHRLGTLLLLAPLACLAACGADPPSPRPAARSRAQPRAHRPRWARRRTRGARAEVAGRRAGRVTHWGRSVPPSRRPGSVDRRPSPSTRAEGDSGIFLADDRAVPRAELAGSAHLDEPASRRPSNRRDAGADVVDGERYGARSAPAGEPNVLMGPRPRGMTMNAKVRTLIDAETIQTLANSARITADHLGRESWSCVSRQLRIHFDLRA